MYRERGLKMVFRDRINAHARTYESIALNNVRTCRDKHDERIVKRACVETTLGRVVTLIPAYSFYARVGNDD